ncbi:MAG: NAD(+)/NADH kinase [Actinobacteria bacterium]|nr:NAD(+)/NADH kinase [Actinomycetota bacterium]
MQLRRVELFLHKSRPEAARLRDELADCLAGNGAEITDQDPDLVIAIGGDGTILRAAQHAHLADAPLLGINFGLLGYLTEIEPGDETAAVKRLSEGAYHLEDRMMLACDTGDGSESSYVALNEALVERASRHRLVELDVRVGDEHLGTFKGDGVIIATPTGSTAYALSAGGPVVSPRAECLVVVPVNPHMMFSRPFILAPDESVEVTVVGARNGGEAALSLDGAIGRDLGHGTTVTVRRHPRPLRLMRLSGPGFVERLRAKLGLPG